MVKTGIGNIIKGNVNYITNVLQADIRENEIFKQSPEMLSKWCLYPPLSAIFAA